MSDWIDATGSMLSASFLLVQALISCDCEKLPAEMASISEEQVTLLPEL